jgi:glycosyltransferase involved in cell wall biosynthesis
MADTLLESLTSVLDQIDDEFEVILIDDSSTDNSKEILRELSSKHNNLKVFYLDKDKKRRLGKTRNISFLKARGQWCIFHIDTDDFIGPHVAEFARLVEILSAKFNKDCLFSGRQIHMAKREFLLSQGPFKNIYRGEDRDLYQRLALTSQWVTILHKRFIFEIPRQKRKLILKTLHVVWDEIVTDMQINPKPLTYQKQNLTKIKQIGVVRTLLRFILAPTAVIVAKRRGIFSTYDRINDPVQFVRYRESTTKTLTEWQSILRIDNIQLDKINREIFY